MIYNYYNICGRILQQKSGLFSNNSAKTEHETAILWVFPKNRKNGKKIKKST